MSELKQTPLYNRHVEAGAKMVPFAGWEMPVQYGGGVIAEHNAVRNSGGLFDVSHMGELWVTGAEAEALLDSLTCNEVKSLIDGRAQYNALINESGGVVDDIIIYRFARDRFFICVNASNTAKDFAWITSHNKRHAEVKNVSADFGQIAIQGPKTIEVLKTLKCDFDPALVSYFHFKEGTVEGVSVIAARTGYTGEDGYEFFVPVEKTVHLWDKLVAAGKPFGVVPAGLGARDSLRLEACLPLHGHELGDEISAIESGLGWIVKPNKGEFTARAILSAHKKDGTPRTLVGFFVDDPGIARGGDSVLAVDGSKIGIVTSGTKTPTLNRALGLALIDSKFKAADTALLLEVRGKSLKAHVTKTPFYKRTSR